MTARRRAWDARVPHAEPRRKANELGVSSLLVTGIIPLILERMLADQEPKLNS
ncbi:hypothetical protein CI1B_32030 [Bradyrhizobium ivorense]|uniref:Uncharacterized protein n=1 Tax=Bradyrhizobium ivorense TaxID=2511166 RepID=A0A508T6M4_9BRAD|nr:hypothetical protein CI1B_32030 [Bradyrhizobium ivorense]